MGASSIAVARAEPANTNDFQAGEGVVDITPPLGLTLGGFHYSPDRPRRVTGVRQPAEARALVVKHGETTLAIVSLDMLNVSFELARKVQARVERETKIPAGHVKVCATHTHSMPSMAFNRQWGDRHPDYESHVESAICQAVGLALADLAPATLYVGTSPAEEGNHNRTAKTWKTERDFGPDSSDEDRWLDTRVQVLNFERAGGKRNLLWYHFSAHPTFYGDGLAGPDWPGHVTRIMNEREGFESVSFLQGHIGDVAPSGDAPSAAKAVADAIGRALADSRAVPIDAIRVARREFRLPFEMDLFRRQIDQYRSDPASCAKGEWVDAAFAKDWHDTFAAKYDMKAIDLPIVLTAARLGSVGLAFHPAELYSVYGLTIERDSPLRPTLVVGYADGYVGYVSDPRSYENQEYAALVVPKILAYPPFAANAGRQMTAALADLWKEVR